MVLRDLQYYILGELITCFFASILTFNTFVSFSPYERRHRLFLYSCISCFLASFFDIISVFCTTYPDKCPVLFNLIFASLFYLFLPVVPVTMLAYTLELAFAYRKRITIIPWIVNASYFLYIILIIVNAFTGWIFYFDAYSNYVYGNLRYITYFYSFVCMFFIETIVLVNRKVMSGRLYSALLVYPIIAVGVILIQYKYPTVLLSGVASFSALLLVYITIQGDMLDYDLLTGLMSQHKLEKHVELKQYDGILFVLSFNNLNTLQMNMDIENYNKMLLDIGKEMSKRFARKSYYLASNKFAAISHNIDDVKKYAREMNDYLDKLHLNHQLHIPIPLDYNCAMTEFPYGEKSYSSIMEVINTLLAVAKNKSDKTLQISDETILKEIKRKKVIYDILKRELKVDSQQYVLNYQPIFSIKDGRFLYMEALSRLQQTELGDISPAEFIPVAEQKGLIEELGNVAFEKVCKYIKENRDVIPAVSVNFSVYQIVNPNVVNMVMDTLNKYGLEPRNIIMEITESIFMDNFGVAYKNMISLASRGIRFYLDDFGTGYSNLANVIGLPFSTIKMDRSFVLMIEQSEKNFKIFTNLVKTFKEAGLSVLVEGVETTKQNDLVIRAGVDYIQGFLYSRPLPAEKCIEVMSKSSSQQK